jgi:hypothetical protein
MEITQNQLIAIILVLIILWVYFTWDSTTEQFCLNNPDYFKSKKWGDEYYYDTRRKYPIVVPSVTRYDSSDYKFSGEALELLKQNEQRKRGKHIDHSYPKGIPVPQNVPSGQTHQFSGPESITQPGANIHAMIEQQMHLPQPEVMNDDESVLHDLQRPSSKMHALHEASFARQARGAGLVENDNEATVPAFQSDDHNTPTIPAYLVGNRMDDNDDDNDFIQEMQKMPINVKSTGSSSQYSLSIAVLMAVLLVGFIYYSKPQI